MTPEQRARAEIDRLLTAAGWDVCDLKQANIHASRGVAIRNFTLADGYGFADYLLYVDAKAAGVIEAKRHGATLSGVETQSAKYSKGLPASLPAWKRPLPFLYESTGVETRFTNGLDPDPRARNAFAFHRPDTLGAWLEAVTTAPATAEAGTFANTFLGRMRSMPPLVEAGLWPPQIVAIKNLEKSLAANKPRALIQMATGSGKTFTAINFIYRLIKFAGARRVLFLVDRGNLGRQTKKEFDQYISPYNNFKFGDLDEFVALYNPANRHERKPTWSTENPEGRWRVYDYAELIGRDKASLDIFWLRDDSLADSDNLPPPGVIAQEIVEDLEAALEQFRLIAEDLGKNQSTGAQE